jgi:hypothetical protein
MLTLLLLAGCAQKPPEPPPGTGAREAALAFFEGLAFGDPPRAYDVLAPESKRRVSAEQFAQLAKTYSRNVGFPVERVHIPACEEQGDAATAHAYLTGHTAGHYRRFEDGAALKRTDGTWGVVLPANFGRRAK